MRGWRGIWGAVDVFHDAVSWVMDGVPCLTILGGGRFAVVLVIAALGSCGKQGPPKSELVLRLERDGAGDLEFGKRAADSDSLEVFMKTKGDAYAIQIKMACDELVRRGVGPGFNETLDARICIVAIRLEFDARMRREGKL